MIDKSYFLTVNRIIDYCFAVMTDENGGFYTAQDADSEGVEGKYYVFTPKEMEDALGRQDAKRFCKLFDITEKGNFEGKSIPNHIGKDLTDEEKVFADECIPRVYEYRKHRISPFKDDKILTMVNALMIAALSIAGYLMNEDNCIAAAKRCAVFIQKTMMQNGRLMASFRKGLTAHPATLEDYSYLAWGLLELYQATFEPKWLIESAQLMDQTIELFGEEGGAFYMSGQDVEDVPVRTKNNHDSALPSGNAVAAMVLMRLSNILENDLYRRKAEDVLHALSGDVNTYPSGFTALLWTQLLKESGLKKIVIVNGDDADDLMKAAYQYHPFADFVVCGKSYEALSEKFAHFNAYIKEDCEGAAYVCDMQGCRPPVGDPESLQKMLGL